MINLQVTFCIVVYLFYMPFKEVKRNIMEIVNEVCIYIAILLVQA